MQGNYSKFETDSQINLVWVGVDPGRERSGLATAAPDSILATPHSVIPTQPVDSFASRLLGGLTPLKPIGFVIGLALDPKGQEGESAVFAREVGELLLEESGLPVNFVDERYSSRDAYARRKEAGFKAKKIRKDLDAYAAAAILQSWIDMGGQSATYGKLDE